MPEMTPLWKRHLLNTIFETHSEKQMGKKKKKNHSRVTGKAAQKYILNENEWKLQ